MNPEKLDFWIKHSLNVLLIGKHGVGKSTVVIEAFMRNTLRWKYFSAATMDPWVDLVGIPKEICGEAGSYIDLVRPKEFQFDEVEAIFLDEFNRSPKKVRNAVMELLQFKSINGKKFNNLKIIWAAVNPDDDDSGYDVEAIDPAQLDRFHIQVTLPYKCDKAYFTKKYGDQASNAISWWDELEDAQKELVSPRRLDYALSVLNMGGDPRDVLPTSCNVSKFMNVLTHGTVYEKIKSLAKQNDPAKIKEWLTHINNVTDSWRYLVKNNALAKLFYPQMPEEVLVSKINEDQKVFKQVMTDPIPYKEILCQAYHFGTNKKLTKKIADEILKTPALGKILAVGNKAADKGSSVEIIANTGFNELKRANTTPERGLIYNRVIGQVSVIPNKTPKDYYAILLFLIELSRRSHVKTLKNYNRCLDNIKECLNQLNASKIPEYSPSKLKQKHAYFFGKMRGLMDYDEMTATFVHQKAV